MPVTYEGDEYPEFVAFTTESVHFGIQQAPAPNDPPSVLTWQIAMSSVDAAAEMCRRAGLAFTLEQDRVALEGPNEPWRECG